MQADLWPSTSEHLSCADRAYDESAYEGSACEKQPREEKAFQSTPREAATVVLPTPPEPTTTSRGERRISGRLTIEAP